MSENKDVTDGGWAQIEFMKRMLDGRIKGKDDNAFLGAGHIKDFKKMTANPNTTVKEYNDFILDVVMRPENKSTRARRLLYANLFLKGLQK